VAVRGDSAQDDLRTRTIWTTWTRRFSGMMPSTGKAGIFNSSERWGFTSVDGFGSATTAELLRVELLLRAA
jgi:hypothetical protein